MTETAIVKVKIFEREYQIKCPLNQQDQLIRTAKYINEKTKPIGFTQNIDHHDSLAAITSLNMTNELLEKVAKLERKLEDANNKINKLNSDLDDIVRASTPPLRKPNISLEELL